MAKVLIVVDSTAKAECMQAYFAARADCVVCPYPIFKTSHQDAPGAPGGLHFQFEGLPAAQDCINALRAYHDQEIFLALDETAQANFLCWQISGYVAQIGGQPKAVKRLAAKGLDQENIDAALRLSWPVEPQLGLSFYSRLLFDDCLARHLGRLLGTDRGPGNLPLRQNSLTTIFLLAEREQERLLFPAVTKWQVQVELPVLDTMFTACLREGLAVDTDGLIRHESKARALRDQLWQTPLLMNTVKRLPLLIAPPEPYQLAELLHDAITLCGLGATSAMGVISKLFHGLSVKGRPTGLISSAAPGTAALAPETVAALRRQVVSLYGETTLHECEPPRAGRIIPLHPELSGADLSCVLNQGEAALYDLIRTRALASQMGPAIGNTMCIDFLAGRENIFQSRLHELSDPGFLRTEPARMAHFQTPYPVSALEAIKEFKAAKVLCEPLTNQGQAAERYTISTLFAALADFSITADPATIAGLEELTTAGYVTLSSHGVLQATDITAKVVAILDRAFPRMQGINLAAYIAQTLAEATSSRKDLPFALRQFEQALMMHGKPLLKAKIPVKAQPRARTASTIIKQATPTLEETPPSAKAEVAEASRPAAESTPPVKTPAEAPPTTKAPQEAAAQQVAIVAPEPAPEEGPEAPPDHGLQALWPDDDLKKVFAEALSEEAQAAEPTEAPLPMAADAPAESSGSLADQSRRCPVCNKSMVFKADQFGSFWACSGFPGCRYSETATACDQGLPCPQCDQELRRKQTPTGKSFFLCENPDCQFMSWSKPHYQPCGLCDSTYLIEKTVRGISQLHCPRAGCSYAEPLPEAEGEGASPVATSAPKIQKVLVRRIAGGSATGDATRKVRLVRRRKP